MIHSWGGSSCAKASAAVMAWGCITPIMTVAGHPYSTLFPSVVTLPAAGVPLTAGVFDNTGADSCEQAEVVFVPVGLPGSPSGVVITGDNGRATGPDCDPTVGDVWWEAFEIDTCAEVTIDFCGTFPDRPSPSRMLSGSCEPDGTCTPFFRALDFVLGTCPIPEGCEPSEETCGRFNPRLSFGALPAGVYYYPVGGGLPGEFGRAPYQITISAEVCVGVCQACRGACCRPTERFCGDDVFQPDCDEAGGVWQHATQCCEIECRPPELDYDALGVELLSRVPIDSFPGPSSRANDVWGYVSPSGREYAILGLNQGTGFVEVTDPGHPVIIADIEDARSSWSDMATFDLFAYNVNENGGGIQIIDMSEIDQGQVRLAGIAQGGLETAHNIFVDSDSGFAYACATDQTFGFIVYDLSDPSDPIPVGLWEEQFDNRGVVRTILAHDLFVTTYEECPFPQRVGRCEVAYVFGGNAGVVVVDVTDKVNMFSIARLTYPTLSFCHQGWLSEDRRYLFFGDEFDERAFDLPTTTYVVDVADPSEPILLGDFTNGQCVIDHNLWVRGDLIFEANYTAGLRVFDFSNVGSIVETAFFDTHPDDNDRLFGGAWGVYGGLPSGLVLLSDTVRGLFVLSSCGRAREIIGDLDDSQSVDLADYAWMQRCFGGDVSSQRCRLADTNCDLEINLLDVDAFIASLTGPRGAP